MEWLSRCPTYFFFVDTGHIIDAAMMEAWRAAAAELGQGTTPAFPQQMVTQASRSGTWDTDKSSNNDRLSE